jgi:CheY-specific phosphatase CheX
VPLETHVETRCQASQDVPSALEVVVARATEALFDAYGLRVRQAGPSSAHPIATEQPTLTAMVGYTSSELEGSVVLTLPERIVASTDPAHDTPRADWIAELTNQLQGRIKNLLIGYGVTVQVSLPLVVCGQGLDAAAAGEDVRYHEFVSDLGAFVVRFHARHAEGFELRAGAETEGCLEEGQLMFF